MKTSQALEEASQKGLDLIEVSPVADPPVCKIMDFGAYQYNLNKKERKHKAKQKKVEVKGIRLTLKIGPNDIETRKRQAIKFLNKGNKVKVELILRGREKAHADRAKDIMNNFSESLASEFQILTEKDVTRQGGKLFMIVSRK